MKKFSFFLAAAVVTTLGLSVSSCSSSDDDNPSVTPVVAETSNVLTVTTNVNATITFDGQTQANTRTATFKTTKSSASLTVSASNYLEQKADVKFAADNKTQAISVTLVKESTVKVSQAEAKGNTVSNDAANKSAVAEASITVPSDVNITGSNAAFSATAYVPVPEVVAEKIKENVVEKGTVFGVACEPDGAVFDKPVTVSFKVADAEGCEFETSEGGKVVNNNGVLSTEVMHFSNVVFRMIATVVSATEGSDVTNANINITNGSNTYEYNQPAGFTTPQTAKGVKALFLASKFGANNGRVKNAVNFTSNAVGSAVLRIVQKYIDYTFRSGNQTFTARVYTDAEFDVTSTSNETVIPTHSGGSNN